MKKTYRYHALEQKIGIRFKNKAILDQAFMHASYLNEHRGEKLKHNERLEFLGDAVLQLVSTNFLYSRFPDATEGELTSYRASVVKGQHLAQVSSSLSLGDYLYLSKGEEKGGGRKKGFLLANTMEALIGAMYLDRGFTVAQKFIEKFILKKLDYILSQGLHRDSKTAFQEFSQEKLGLTPTYDTVSEEGPAHNRIFTVAAFIDKKIVAEGKGSSKQIAQQEAALKALRALKSRVSK